MRYEKTSSFQVKKPYELLVIEFVQVKKPCHLFSRIFRLCSKKGEKKNEGRKKGALDKRSSEKKGRI